MPFFFAFTFHKETIDTEGSFAYKIRKAIRGNLSDFCLDGLFEGDRVTILIFHLQTGDSFSISGFTEFDSVLY